jgi:hypothetical protein
MIVYCVGCGPSSGHGTIDAAGTGIDSSMGGLDSGGSSSDAGSGSSDGGQGVTYVYAHSSTTLYRVDPDTLAVTMVGAFGWS